MHRAADSRVKFFFLTSLKCTFILVPVAVLHWLVDHNWRSSEISRWSRFSSCLSHLWRHRYSGFPHVRQILQNLSVELLNIWCFLTKCFIFYELNTISWPLCGVSVRYGILLRMLVSDQWLVSEWGWSLVWDVGSLFNLSLLYPLIPGLLNVSNLVL